MLRRNSNRTAPSMASGSMRESVDVAIKGTRSPLTRKIIIFNLVTLSLLVTGILVLSQSRASLIDLRKQNLQADAAVLAKSLEFQMEFSGISDFYEPAL